MRISQFEVVLENAKIHILPLLFGNSCLRGIVPRTVFPPKPIFGRIVGGEITTIEDVPFQVVLLRSMALQCGGSILSQNVVLTAAHCTANELASSLSIRAGSSTYLSGGLVVNIREKIEHPNYDQDVDYDFAALRLMNHISFTQAIQPIALPKQDESVSAGIMAMTSGWGHTAPGGSFSPVIRKVYIPIVEQDVCAAAYASLKPITDRMICAGRIDLGGKDACQGDSGGPLVINDVLIGVTSWGNGCGRRGYPGVWARVPSVVQWIQIILTA